MTNMVYNEKGLLALMFACIGQEADSEFPGLRVFPTSVEDAFACVDGAGVLVPIKNGTPVRPMTELAKDKAATLNDGIASAYDYLYGDGQEQAEKVGKVVPNSKRHYIAGELGIIDKKVRGLATSMLPVEVVDKMYASNPFKKIIELQSRVDTLPMADDDMAGQMQFDFGDAGVMAV